MRAPIRIPQALGPLSLAAGALGAAQLLAGCSQPITGEILLAIDTDLAMPKDLDALHIDVVSAAGVARASIEIKGFGEEAGARLPGTFGVAVSEDPSELVTLRVIGRRGGEARVEHAITTTIPEDRVAVLRMPLHFLCRTIDAEEPDEVSCPVGQTCFAGTCRSNRIDSSGLPDYDEAAIFGDGRCFDVARCFEGSAPLEGIDPDACTFTANDDVNVALTSESDGLCGTSGCFVALDAGSELGWTRLADGTIQLPASACPPGPRAGLGVRTAPVGDGCPLKTVALPTCGPWSSAGPEPDPSRPPEPVVLAAWQDSPVALALDDTQVYWINQGTSGGVDGAVRSIARAGGAPITLADKQATPRSIVVDQGRALWTNRGETDNDGSLMAFSPGGSAGSLLTGLDQPEGLALAGGLVFWTQYSGGVFRATSLGANSAPLEADSGAPYGIAAAADRVCWTDHRAGSVTCQPLVSGVPAGDPLPISGEEATPHAIALDVDAEGKATAVYWVNLGAMERAGEVVRVSLVGGVIGEREVLASGQPHPIAIALDEASVFWTNRGDGTVMKLLKTGGKAPEAIATQQHNPGAIVAAGDAIVWVNEGKPGARNGAVVRLYP